jgi:Holliday junction resolvase-like predicted endonuclease
VSKKLLPKEVIENWPEVFGEIDVKVIPLEYLHTMSILFVDGTQWEFKVSDYIKKSGSSNLETEIQELIATYEDSIDHINLRIDVKKVKSDITKKTKSFLKTTNKKK